MLLNVENIWIFSPSLEILCLAYTIKLKGSFFNISFAFDVTLLVNDVERL